MTQIDTPVSSEPAAVPERHGAVGAALKQIAANAPLAVQATKRLIHDSDRFGSDGDDEIWDHHDAVIAPVFGSEDAVEGARAFAEKRAPRWTGR